MRILITILISITFYISSCSNGSGMNAVKTTTTTTNTPANTVSTTPDTSVLTQYETFFLDDIKSAPVFSKVDNSNLTFEFAPLATDVIAQCTLYSNSNNPSVITSKLISVSPTYWATASNTRKIDFMYHELSHCLLIRGHLTNKISFTFNSQTIQAPYSIMYPSPVSSVVYPNGDDFFNTNLSYYLTEMIDPARFGDMQMSQAALMAKNTTLTNNDGSYEIATVMQTRINGNCTSEMVVLNNDEIFKKRKRTKKSKNIVPINYTK